MGVLTLGTHHLYTLVVIGRLPHTGFVPYGQASSRVCGPPPSEKVAEADAAPPAAVSGAPRASRSRHVIARALLQEPTRAHERGCARWATSFSQLMPREELPSEVERLGLDDFMACGGPWPPVTRIRSADAPYLVAAGMVFSPQSSMEKSEGVRFDHGARGRVPGGWWHYQVCPAHAWMLIFKPVVGDCICRSMWE